jgi:hypothetical protein
MTSLRRPLRLLRRGPPECASGWLLIDIKHHQVWGVNHSRKGTRRAVDIWVLNYREGLRGNHDGPCWEGILAFMADGKASRAPNIVEYSTEKLDDYDEMHGKKECWAACMPISTFATS